VKIGDFGISKLMSTTNPAASTVLGTPYYISPEMVGALLCHKCLFQIPHVAEHVSEVSYQTMCKKCNKNNIYIHLKRCLCVLEGYVDVC